MAATTGSRPRNTLEMLDKLIEAFYGVLKENAKDNTNLKEFIKMVEVRKKLAPGGADQSEFWAMLDKMRQEVMGGRKKTGTRKKKPEKSSNANAA